MLTAARFSSLCCSHFLRKLGLLRRGVRISMLLVLILSSFLITYYFTGATFLPRIALLLMVAQILSRGISASCSIVLDLLVRRAQTIPVAIDIITAFFIDLETRLGGCFNWKYLVSHGFTELLLKVTPEVLVTFLSKDVADVRRVGSVHRSVQLGCFGGAFNESSYWTSGLTLLNSRNPDVEFREIACEYKKTWIVPRIPVVWYEKYAELGKPKNYNSFEKQIYVPKNPAVAITRTVVPDEGICQKSETSDFGYYLIIYSCPGKRFGFSIGGPDLPRNTAFFHLRKGWVSVWYKSIGRARTVSSMPLLHNSTAIPFPRINQLFQDMGPCFLNAISFHRTVTQIPIMEQLAIASIVRIASLKSPSGFDHPPLYADAWVSEVQVTNLSRFSLVTTIASDLAIAFYMLYSLAMGGLLLPSALSSIIAACSLPSFVGYLQDMNDNSISRIFQNVRVRISRNGDNRLLFDLANDTRQEQSQNTERV